jgi:hypothetical protein
MIKILQENINDLSDSNMKIAYMKNKEKSGYFGNRYGQNIEPAGEYVTVDDLYEERPDNYMLPNYEYGFITFRKPLIIDFIDTTDKGWKLSLSNMFNGKTKKALSTAIKRKGYDGIVTVSEYGIEEVVNLAGDKEALYST